MSPDNRLNVTFEPGCRTKRHVHHHVSSVCSRMLKTRDCVAPLNDGRDLRRSPHRDAGWKIPSEVKAQTFQKETIKTSTHQIGFHQIFVTEIKQFLGRIWKNSAKDWQTRDGQVLALA